MNEYMCREIKQFLNVLTSSSLFFYGLSSFHLILYYSKAKMFEITTIYFRTN